MLERVESTKGGDTDAANVAIRAGEHLAKLTGVHAPEKIAHIGGEREETVDITDIVNAEREAERLSLEAGMVVLEMPTDEEE